MFSILFTALAQATDCLKAADRLAPATRKAYDSVRAIVPKIVEDEPFYGYIAEVEKWLRNNPLNLD